MAKKRKLIGRLEIEIANLRAELARVEKDAKRRLKKAEQDAAALRGELLRFIGQTKPTPSSPAIPKAAEPAATRSADTAAKAPTAVVGEPDKKAPVAKGPATKAPAKKTAAKKVPEKKVPTKKAAAPAAKSPTVKDLREQAKGKGVKGYSTMTKAELLKALG